MAELNRWQNANTASFVLCEAIGLLGFALRYLGSTREQAIPFYGAAILLLLIFFPRNPARQ